MRTDLVFPAGSDASMCVNITIVLNTAEQDGPKNFIVLASINPLFTPVSTTITIEDGSYVLYLFVLPHFDLALSVALVSLPTAMSVQEGAGVVQICAMLLLPPGRTATNNDVIVTIATDQGNC